MLWSIITRSPRSLIAEIILVDDASERGTLLMCLVRLSCMSQTVAFVVFRNAGDIVLYYPRRHSRRHEYCVQTRLSVCQHCNRKTA